MRNWIIYTHRPQRLTLEPRYLPRRPSKSSALCIEKTIENLRSYKIWFGFQALLYYRTHNASGFRLSFYYVCWNVGVRRNFTQRYPNRNLTGLLWTSSICQPSRNPTCDVFFYILLSKTESFPSFSKLKMVFASGVSRLLISVRVSNVFPPFFRTRTGISV